MFIFVCKTVFLFAFSLMTLPIIFFLLVGLFGNYFYISIDRSSWLAKTKIKVIRNVVKRFIIM